MLMMRAFRGLRQHVRTQLVSIGTVALALFCLAGAMLALENAGALAARWGAPVRMTVYLADGATSAQVESLRGALANLPEVAETRYVSPSETRAAVVGATGEGSLQSAAVELFPSTLELRLTPGAVTVERVQSLAERIRRLGTVTDVETYRGLTDQVRGLLAGGRTAVLFLALLVLVCATAVVSNTVRLSLHARLREVEVLRLVGASPQFVRAPFLVEGAVLGSGGAAVALMALGGLFAWLRGHGGSTFGAVLGIAPVFLSLGIMVLFVAGGAMLGATGSALALRRGLRT